MGTSHVRSNLEGKAGTETITNFATIGDTSTALVGASLTSAAVTATGATQGATVVATNYVKIGNIYIFSGSVGTNSSASILAAATSALGTHPIPKGSMFMNASPGCVWAFTATMTAATLNIG
jgi:hypothetical protein